MIRNYMESQTEECRAGGERVVLKQGTHLKILNTILQPKRPPFQNVPKASFYFMKIKSVSRGKLMTSSF